MNENYFDPLGVKAAQGRTFRAEDQSAPPLVGVFSVINYSTSRRTREIWIRLVLGAQRVDILRMIIKEALSIVVGVVVGLLMAFASGRLMASFLFANSGAEVSVCVASALLLIAIEMLACLIPAYKAMKVDPNDALGNE